MIDTERAILEAAFDYAEAQNALDHGCPAQEMLRKATDRLLDAVAAHAADNDGEYRIVS